MRKSELNQFLDSLAPTAAQKDKVLDAILKGEQIMHTRKMKLSLALVAALVASLVGLTAMAAAFGWHEKLIAYLSPTATQMDVLGDASNAPQVTATDNGVTVSVLQTLTDQHGIYILYDVTVPDSVTLPEDVTWELSHLGMDTAAAGTGQVAMGSGGADVIARTDHTLTILQRDIWTDAITNDQKVSLTLQNLVRYDSTGDDIQQEVLVPCQFDLTWTLHYTDSTTTFDVNQPVDITGSNHNVLTSISLSPMTLWITVTGDDVLGAIKPWITYHNGETFQITQEDRSASYLFLNDADQTGGTCSISYAFDRITDLSEIASITVGNVVVPIS